MRLRWRFRAFPFLITLLLVLLGVALGNWQTRRAEEKVAHAARLAQQAQVAPLVWGQGGALAPAQPEQRLQVSGEWLAQWPLLLDGRPYQGRAGFYLLMPFKIAGTGQAVLVLRGWLARDPQVYTRVPAFATPTGLVTIVGRASATAGHVMQLGRPAPVQPGAVRQNLTIAEVAAASGLALQPLFLQQTDAGSADGLVRDWPAADLGVDKHRGYALQWYALAVMAALFFVFTGYRRASKQAD